MALPHILAVLVVLLCTFYQANAHGWMSNPLPRGQYTSPKKRVDLEYAPTANNDPFNPDVVCRSDPDMPISARPTYTAGQKLDVQISYNAQHPGACFFYLSYDGDKPDAQKKWFKIFEQTNCQATPKLSVTIPSYLPSASHAVLRWEWYALHLWTQGTGHVEYFASCTDVQIVGFNGGQLPQPQVNIPGHLPLPSGDNYWDPYNGAPEYFTGPPVATLNGVVPTQAPATQAPATQAPATQAPATQAPATQAPTQRPSAAPTTRPPSAGTSRPAATPAPTQAPATQSPTPAPVSSAACSEAEIGHMRCLGDNTYHTCVHGKWGGVANLVQYCGTGLVCSEDRPPYIYCVVPPACDE